MKFIVNTGFRKAKEIVIDELKVLCNEYDYRQTRERQLVYETLGSFRPTRWLEGKISHTLTLKPMYVTNSIDSLLMYSKISIIDEETKEEIIFEDCYFCWSENFMTTFIVKQVVFPNKNIIESNIEEEIP